MAPLPALAVDIETCSACPIQAGSWRYSEHPSTRVWCVVFGVEGRPGMGRYMIRWTPGLPVPPLVRQWVESCRPMVAHNAGFEASIWANVLVPRYGFPALAGPTVWEDTQTLGLAVNLPPTLEGLADALGCPTKKDAEGAALMKRLAHAEEGPDGTWTYPEPTPEELDRLVAYCQTDVEATLDCYLRLPELSVSERMTVDADLAVNTRGVYLDRDFAARLARMAEARTNHLATEVWAATFGELSNSTSTPALKTWVKKHGVQLPKVVRKKASGVTKSESLDKSATADLLAQPDLHPDVRKVLSNRIEANKATSLAKLARVDSMTGQDGRLRFALQYCGANTGRWASYGLQVHNLPKDKLSPAAGALARFAVESEDVGLLELFEDMPLAVMSQQLRSVIAAPPGRELIAADYSAIEARVVAWLAGQVDVLDFLHNYDREMAEFRDGRRTTKPTDLYEYAAGQIGSDDRQLGKVSTLALGFGMGDARFVETAHAWGIFLEPLQARNVKRAWRDSNHAIAGFWEDLGDTVRAVVMSPESGPQHVGRLVVEGSPDRAWFVIVLPSGRRLFYWRPSIVRSTKKVQVVDDDGSFREVEFDTESVRYWVTRPDKRGMVQTETYGGKLVENVTQAVARDILAEALPRIESTEPYRLVMHVHDSAAAEVPIGGGDVREFEALLATPPDWAGGLPIAAEGYRDTRFRG